MHLRLQNNQRLFYSFVLFVYFLEKGLPSKFIHTSFYAIAITAKTNRSRLVAMFRFYWRLREPPTTSREYASDVNSARRRKCSVSAAVTYPSLLTSPRPRESMLWLSANVWKARRLVFSRMAERKWLGPLEAAGFLGTKENSSRLTLPLSCALIIVNFSCNPRESYMRLHFNPFNAIIHLNAQQVSW